LLLEQDFVRDQESENDTKGDDKDDVSEWNDFELQKKSHDQRE
jgi:hypothetical protein